ncbi:MAG: HIT family protein [Verrucomicrobiales bacterium]|nr:HIT family protein [Verrucomicrobiales bacterium]
MTHDPKHDQDPHLGSPLVLPVFGSIEPERILATDDIFAVILDKYPVSPGHTLIIPRRAVSRFADLSAEERARLLDWFAWVQEALTRRSPKPDGLNFGLNDGPAAGQTMPQLHFHVIPRYVGDVPDPRGGIRWVVPSKAKYW